MMHAWLSPAAYLCQFKVRNCSTAEPLSDATRIQGQNGSQHVASSPKEQQVEARNCVDRQMLQHCLFRKDSFHDQVSGHVQKFGS